MNRKAGKDVTYWLVLFFAAIGVVAVVLFSFRERFERRKAEREEVRTRPFVSLDMPEPVHAAAATPTATPVDPGELQPTPTATSVAHAPSTTGDAKAPDRDALRRDTARLRDITKEWVYRGYAQMGTRGIARFAYSKQKPDTFTASKGDEVEGITIEKLERTRAVLRFGVATIDLLLEPEAEPTPTPVPKKPVRPKKPGSPPAAEIAPSTAEQETSFEPGATRE